MIDRDRLIRYCRQQMDEQEARELEEAIQSDPQVREEYRKLAQETVLDAVAGQIDESPLDEAPLDETDPDVAARREFIARQMDECRRSEWWSLTPEATREFADLHPGQSLRATVRRLRMWENDETGFMDYPEESFSIEVRRLTESRFRLRCDDWPTDYRVLALRLGRFELPGFPSLSAGKLPHDDRVERSPRAGKSANEPQDAPDGVMEASSTHEPGVLACADGKAVDDDTHITQAEKPEKSERPEIRITLDRERLTITLRDAGPPVIAVAEMVRMADGGKRLSVKRRAVVLAPRGRRRMGIVKDFDFPVQTREQDVRVSARPLEADDFYLLQHPDCKPHLDDILADQPASSASAAPCEGGYEVPLWTEQYDLARDPTTCWALQVVPTQEGPNDDV